MVVINYFILYYFLFLFFLYMCVVCILLSYVYDVYNMIYRIESSIGMNSKNIVYAVISDVATPVAFVFVNGALVLVFIIWTLIVLVTGLVIVRGGYWPWNVDNALVFFKGFIFFVFFSKFCLFPEIFKIGF